MPQDIFGSNITHSGNSIITAHQMLLTMETDGGGGSTAGALVQNVVIQYSQPIQIVREVGSKNFYYFAQPPQGTVNFGRIVASDKDILDVLPKGPKNIWAVPGHLQQNPALVLKSIDTNISSVKYTMLQCIVENLGINTDANGAFVQEQVSIRFGSMQISSR